MDLRRLIAVGAGGAALVVPFLTRSAPTPPASSAPPATLEPLEPLEARAAGADPLPTATQQTTNPLITYRVSAQRGIRNRKVIGEVTHEIRGVPASPVDSLCLDGKGVVKIRGSAELEVDTIKNTGWAKARWTDEHGDWEVLMDFFAHPHHASGLRIGADAFTVDRVILDPVVTNVAMHGNTTAGLPGAPTVFAYLGIWGPAAVKLNGQPFENELDGTFKPKWEGHMMVTAGVRGDDGAIRATDGKIYDPAIHSAMGMQQHNDIELHLVLTDGRYPEDPANRPSLYQFFYDIVFEEVQLSIDHTHEDGDQ